MIKRHPACQVPGQMCPVKIKQVSAAGEVGHPKECYLVIALSPSGTLSLFLLFVRSGPNEFIPEGLNKGIKNQNKNRGVCGGVLERQRNTDGQKDRKTEEGQEKKSKAP